MLVTPYTKGTVIRRCPFRVFGGISHAISHEKREMHYIKGRRGAALGFDSRILLKSPGPYGSGFFFETQHRQGFAGVTDSYAK